MSEITGTLKVKLDTNKVSDRFQKRDFVLTTEANTPYPQTLIVQVTQDKCSLLDQFNVGDELKVQINIRGKEWTNPQGEVKYFVTLEAWRLEKIGSAPGNNQQAAPSGSAPADDDDQLPF